VISWSFNSLLTTSLVPPLLTTTSHKMPSSHPSLDELATTLKQAPLTIFRREPQLTYQSLAMTGQVQGKPESWAVTFFRKVMISCWATSWIRKVLERWTRVVSSQELKWSSENAASHFSTKYTWYGWDRTSGELCDNAQLARWPVGSVHR